MTRTIFPVLLGSTLLLSCASDSGSSDRGAIGKADLLGSCAAQDGSSLCGGPSEGNCWCDDLCVDFGDCCADRDDVCQPAEGGCTGLACGDACTLCPPDDPDCFETDVLKFCSASGECVSAVPECPGTYDPCAGLSCGDACTLCAPGDPDCFETSIPKFCDAGGTCGTNEGTCP